MPRVRGPGGGRLRSGSGARYRCADCPCETTISVCGCTPGWPAEFDIEPFGFSDNSCSSCDERFHVRIPVAYAGTISCEGDTWHYWESAADVYGSPGDCSGCWDDRIWRVFARNGSGSDCMARAELISTAKTACDGLFDGGLNCFQGRWTRTLNAAFGADARPCSDLPELRNQAWYNSGVCNVGDVYLHLFGT